MFGWRKEHKLSQTGKRAAQVLDGDRALLHFEAGGRRDYPYNSIPDAPGKREVARAFHRLGLSGSLLRKNRIPRP